MRASDQSAVAGRPPGWLQSLRRYVLVGAGSAITDLSLYAALVRFAGWDPLLANLVSRPCGGLLSFLLNKLWTFGRREARDTTRQALRFACVWLGAYALSEGLIAVFSRVAGWPAVPSKAAAEVLTGFFIFLSHRLWTFRAPPP